VACAELRACGRRLRRQYDMAEPLYSEALQLLARALRSAQLACVLHLRYC
jgi:hypothetical protein